MNNIFNNENYYPYGTQFGSAYPQPAPQPQYTQPLTEEEQAELMKKSVPFTTRIDRIDLLKSYCTHRKGKDTALVQNPDGSFTCSICGSTMNLDEYTEDDVNEICDKYNNLLNNIKVKYYDMPVDIVKEFMQIMPFIERTPKLYKIANDNFGRYAGYNQSINPAMASPTYNVWNNFNTMHGGYGVPMYGQPQPNYQYPGYQDPNMQYMYGQPMSTMGMQQSQMVAGNPLYAQPAPQPMMNQPQAPAPAQVPNQQAVQQPNMNAQPAPQKDNTVTTTATVSL